MNLNATLLGQVIAFSFFLLFCIRYIWKPLINAIEARKEKISKGLKDAQDAKSQLEESHSFYQKNIREAQKKATEIVKNALEQQEIILEQAKQAAKAEGDKILELAREQIRREKDLAKQEVLSHLAELVISSTEKIIKEELKQDQRKRILNKMIS